MRRGKSADRDGKRVSVERSFLPAGGASADGCHRGLVEDETVTDMLTATVLSNTCLLVELVEVVR